MKRFTVLVLVLLFSGMVGAQAAAQEVDSGWVGPGSFLYGLDTGWDSFLVGIGLKSAGSVVKERAAEIRSMARANNTAGVGRAAAQIRSSVAIASVSDERALETAMTVLGEVREYVPAQARGSLDRVLVDIEQTRRQVVDREQGQQPVENAGERMEEARQLRAQAVTALERGKGLLDSGSYGEAIEAFENATQQFNEAAGRVSGIRSADAQTLREELQDAAAGTAQLREVARAYQRGNTAEADQRRQQAQDQLPDFARSD